MNPPRSSEPPTRRWQRSISRAPAPQQAAFSPVAAGFVPGILFSMVGPPLGGSTFISKHCPPGYFPSRIELATLAPVAFLEEKFGEWKLVSRVTGIAWLSFYAIFLLYAFANRSGFLILDYVNLIIHEGGHFFFSWFGNTIMILGGTLGELLVPLLCAIYFFFQRETTGFAFSLFWFFENFPYIGNYMADARSAALPLVGS